MFTYTSQTHPSATVKCHALGLAILMCSFWRGSSLGITNKRLSQDKIYNLDSQI